MCCSKDPGFIQKRGSADVEVLRLLQDGSLEGEDQRLRNIADQFLVSSMGVWLAS